MVVGKNIKYALKTMIGRFSRGSLLLNHLLPEGKSIPVSSSTTVCIAGFPRTGNTFFFNYFDHFNPSEVIAHHRHLPCQLWDAERRNIPAIVLVREPLETIASLLVADRQLSPGLAIRSYIEFYKKVAEMKCCQVAMFDSAIHMPATVIRKTNERFGSRFVAGRLTPDLEKRIRTKIEEHHERTSALPLLIPLPTEEKGKLKEEVKTELERFSSLDRAIDIYRLVKERHDCC